jgi:hypothetical protein
MPKKKAATAAESTEDTRQRRNARPDDPSYQAPAFASEEEVALLGEDIDSRMKALLKDHKKMGVR